MIPYLFSYGFFTFNLYGFFIGIGLVVFLWAMGKDHLTAKYLTSDQLTYLVLWSAIVAAVGGRLWCFVTEYEKFKTWYELFAPWEPGFSLLGSIVALLVFIPAYLYVHRLALLPVLDLIGTYAPLMQSISRIGCFCAGCCYGYPSHVPWAITYWHPDSYAIVGIPCHPTQLYSVLGLFVLFVLLRFVARRFVCTPGYLFAWYLIGSSIERFINDFFRAEHYESAQLWFGMLSVHQLLALALAGCGVVLFLIPARLYKKL